MKKLLVLLFVVTILSCGEKTKKGIKSIEKVKPFNNVEVNHLVEDSLLNVRAMDTWGSSLIIATSSGKVIIVSDPITIPIPPVKLIERNKIYDSLQVNFRAVSTNGGSIFSLGIASPTLLFKDEELVYQENHPKAFYDAMDFWNDNEGIAIGDPTDNCMSIIITRDGGNTWNKLPCSNLPKAKEGEAAFAASDTNIAIVGDKTWVATGGKASRILYSPDKGLTWEVFNTPIVQGLETTGIYSIDFYDELNGFAIGGDYTKPEDNAANKIRTKDGGKTWQLVAENANPGYRSCVQYVPNSNAKELVAVGFKGIDYSSDSGNTWKHLSDEGYYTIRFLNDSTAYAAGNGRVSKLVFR
ncbi:WD40/YVTN/BNR-like repeat-containing protein [Aurantibacter sp.]|uniref:WD40/YVTN/BNR-like repeat-containing protein n=1 Tax=Aurantibacter sp. TaxID=2807103 RepID=UPI0035C86BCA